jgi:hypothetical protein
MYFASGHGYRGDSSGAMIATDEKPTHTAAGEPFEVAPTKEGRSPESGDEGQESRVKGQVLTADG